MVYLTALTKLDVLDSFDNIKVCMGYNINGNETEYMSEALNNLNDVQPVYIKLFLVGKFLLMM